MGNYAAGAYYGAVANGYAWANGYVTAEPAVFAYCYGVSRLDGATAQLVVDGVLWRVERAVGSDEGAISDGDVGSVEHHAVVVNEHVFAYV